MLAPPGRATREQSGLLGSTLLFLLGLVAGGLAIASVLYLMTGLGRAAIVRFAFTGLAMWLLLFELKVARFPWIPTKHELIPDSRFKRSLEFGLLVFGFELGLGFRTKIVSAAPPIVALTALTIGPDLVPMLVAGLAWGLGRSSTAFVRIAQMWNLPNDQPDIVASEQFDRLLQRISRPASLLASLSSVFLLAYVAVS